VVVSILLKTTSSNSRYGWRKWSGKMVLDDVWQNLGRGVKHRAFRGVCSRSHEVEAKGLKQGTRFVKGDNKNVVFLRKANTLQNRKLLVFTVLGAVSSPGGRWVRERIA